MPIMTFQEALANSAERRHLLLGNGFSIALRPDIFSYQSLYNKADFSDVPYAQKFFELLGTSDFEAVIRAVVNAAKILRAYKGVDDKLIAKLNDDASMIKHILVAAIGEHHPDRPFDIEPQQYAACRRFLSNFSHIYTLNYDILLYWALMQDEVDELDLHADDGFRNPEDEDDAPYVSWIEAQSATVHFLHGALHLFDAGSQIIKYTWSKTEIPLLDQIREALSDDRYPLFVSEGHSEDKLEKVLHNAYLHKGLRSFETVCGQKASALFIFGHSLAENDRHILRKIASGSIGEVWISLYGDPESAENRTIRANAEALVGERQKKRKVFAMRLSFFSAESANVWG